MEASRTNTALESLAIETIQGLVLAKLIQGLPNIFHLKVLKCDHLFVPYILKQKWHC
jgi:hypothetical protein